MPELSRQQVLQLAALDRVSKYLRSMASNVHELPPEISRILYLLIDAQRNLTEAAEIHLSSRPHRAYNTPEHMWNRALQQLEEALAEAKRRSKDQWAGQQARKGNES